MSETSDLPLIISPDTQRDNRVPPNQRPTRKYVEYTAHRRPAFDAEKWRFRIRPELTVDGKGLEWTWQEFAALPRVRVKADFHCVTRWSVLDNVWEGVPTRELLKHVQPKPEARFVMVHCTCGYTTNLPVGDFFGEDCVFATKLNDQDLPIPMGYPMRLIVPRLYAWKSAKWADGLQFLTDDTAGFWEKWEHGGYHMRGDPWLEQRHRDDFGGSSGSML